MKEKPKFSGVSEWTILSGRLDAVEIAAAQAKTVDVFNHEIFKASSEEMLLGVTKVGLSEVTQKSYTVFCATLEAEYQKAYKRELAEKALDWLYPNGRPSLKIVPNDTISSISLTEELEEEMIVGA
jgi:hypothetical protein